MQGVAGGLGRDIRIYYNNDQNLGNDGGQDGGRSTDLPLTDALFLWIDSGTGRVATFGCVPTDDNPEELQ